MKRAKLWQSPPVHIPRGVEGIQLAAQLIQLGTEEYLEIDVFMDEVRTYRYFAENGERKEFCARGTHDEKWNTCKMETLVRMADPNISPWQACSYEKFFASEEDHQLVLDYIGTYSLNNFEYSVSNDKWMRKIRRKEERIDAVMAKVMPLDDAMLAWVDETIFTGHYTMKDKETGAFRCTSCGHTVTDQLKHGREYTCPACGTQTKVESRLPQKKAAEPIIIMQTMEGGEWVERQFMGHCLWTPGEKRIEMYEKIRAVIPNRHQWGKLYYGQADNADEFEQSWWTSNVRMQHFRASYLYPGNLREVMEAGGLEHFALDLIAETGEKFHANKWVLEAAHRPYIEYMVKAGLTNLAREIVDDTWLGSSLDSINEKARKLKDVLKLDGNRASRMRQLNGGRCMLRWLQYEQDKDIHISTEALTWLQGRKIYPHECRDILMACRSVERMVNYLKKQVKRKDLLDIWADYIRMAEQNGMDVTDDIVRFPKDLQRRHDELVEIRNRQAEEEKDRKNAEKYAELDAKILKHMPEVRRLFCDSEKYMVIPAGKCMELVQEGRTLHHCVGASTRYMEKMAEGKSWICFLRKKEELETAYYTLEIELGTDRILQWYSAYDRKPDHEEIQQFLEIYKKGLKAA